jgi:hypothetical protein
MIVLKWLRKIVHLGLDAKIFAENLGVGWQIPNFKL